MVEIPVEKKSGIPAWLWLLLALIALGMLVWWYSSQSENEVDAIDDAETAQVVEADPDAEIAGTDVDTGVEALAGAAGLADLSTKIGRDVSMDSIAVNRVIGDEAFTIGTGSAETLVMFDEKATPDTAMEGNVDVNPGSMVKLRGNVRELAVSDLPQSVKTDLDGKNAAYIFADMVEVVN